MNASVISASWTIFKKTLSYWLFIWHDLPQKNLMFSFIILISADSMTFCTFWSVDNSAEIWSGQISGRTDLKVGDTAQLKCSTFDLRGSRKLLYTYLCKNRAGLRVEVPGNHTFTLRDVLVLDSGKYSCVYSLKEHPLNSACINAKNSIQLQITGKKIVFPHNQNKDLKWCF